MPGLKVLSLSRLDSLALSSAHSGFRTQSGQNFLGCSVAPSPNSLHNTFLPLSRHFNRSLTRQHQVPSNAVQVSSTRDTLAPKKGKAHTHSYQRETFKSLTTSLFSVICDSYKVEAIISEESAKCNEYHQYLEVECLPNPLSVATTNFTTTEKRR